MKGHQMFALPWHPYGETVASIPLHSFTLLFTLSYLSHIFTNAYLPCCTVLEIPPPQPSHVLELPRPQSFGPWQTHCIVALHQRKRVHPSLCHQSEKARCLLPHTWQTPDTEAKAEQFNVDREVWASSRRGLQACLQYLLQHFTQRTCEEAQITRVNPRTISSFTGLSLPNNLGHPWPLQLFSSLIPSYHLLTHDISWDTWIRSRKKTRSRRWINRSSLDTFLRLSLCPQKHPYTSRSQHDLWQ